ncbi:MAG: peptidylprolyl isomerase [Acidobacteriota bacterium]
MAIATAVAVGASAQAPTTPAKKPAAPAAGTAAKKPATGQAATPAKPAPARPAGARGRASAAPTAAARLARLKNPAGLKEMAPPTFNAAFNTTAGPFVIQVHRDWAPKAADRFYNLVKNGFFTGNGFFRVLPNFMVQFGIHGTPSIQSAWRDANITDDPVKQSNKRGYITFAMTPRPDTRSTQVFINFKDNASLDGQGFAPFGEVISGMENVDKINPEYMERPDQGAIQARGNTYLKASFPKLDYVLSAAIEKAPVAPKAVPSK